MDQGSKAVVIDTGAPLSCTSRRVRFSPFEPGLRTWLSQIDLWTSVMRKTELIISSFLGLPLFWFEIIIPVELCYFWELPFGICKINISIPSSAGRFELLTNYFSLRYILVSPFNILIVTLWCFEQKSKIKSKLNKNVNCKMLIWK